MESSKKRLDEYQIQWGRSEYSQESFHWFFNNEFVFFWRKNLIFEGKFVKLCQTIWIRQTFQWFRPRSVSRHSGIEIRPAYRFLSFHINVAQKRFSDLNYIDIDPLYREIDLTKWNTLLVDQADSTDVKADIKQQLLHERQRLSSTKLRIFNPL